LEFIFRLLLTVWYFSYWL